MTPTDTPSYEQLAKMLRELEADLALLGERLKRLEAFANER
jgi:hypothetical protein